MSSAQCVNPLIHKASETFLLCRLTAVSQVRALFEAPNKKIAHRAVFFVSVGTSAQFSRLRHRIAVTERGCYLSQTKQSGELFWRCDTMRQRQLPTTYSKSQVRAARTSQSSFCHFVTFPLSGESLFEAPNKKIAHSAVFFVSL